MSYPCDPYVKVTGWSKEFHKPKRNLGANSNRSIAICTAFEKSNIQNNGTHRTRQRSPFKFILITSLTVSGNQDSKQRCYPLQSCVFVQQRIANNSYTYNMPVLHYMEISHCYNLKDFPCSVMEPGVWRKN
ncbi:hypothetical protein M0R45_000080 [Rubus argutus]|uniref:Uncharacterized protein n=1 Tax=Rubus argutus TaxID=59490 RepID=A0AAW1VLW1_RUBAR